MQRTPLLHLDQYMQNKGTRTQANSLKLEKYLICNKNLKLNLEYNIPVIFEFWINILLIQIL